jgi:ribosome-interacting GTPase 1
MKLNFDGLLEKIWDHLDLVRVYTKKAHENPDFGDPIVLTNDRNGCSVKSVC